MHVILSPIFGVVLLHGAASNHHPTCGLQTHSNTRDVSRVTCVARRVSRRRRPITSLVQLQIPQNGFIPGATLALRHLCKRPRDYALCDNAPCEVEATDSASARCSTGAVTSPLRTIQTIASTCFNYSSLLTSYD